MTFQQFPKTFDRYEQLLKRMPRFRRSVKQTKSGVWATVMLDGIDVTTTNQAFDIVADADWVVIAGTRMATIRGIRGWLSIAKRTSTVANAMMAIGVTSENVGAAGGMVPNVVTNYADEDVMWTGGFQGGASVSTFRDWDLDIKSMRKIRSGKECRLYAISDTDIDIRISGVIRAYLTYT